MNLVERCQKAIDYNDQLYNWLQFILCIKKKLYFIRP